ncbi:membrane-bound proton-translocating pyrophosphatase, partial [mine drainage metagenome]
TAVSAMLLAYFIGSVITTNYPNAILYPLVVCAWAIIATIVGIAFVRMRPGGTIMGALYQGLGATTVVGVVGLFYLNYTLMNGNWGMFVATVVGLVVMVLIVLATDYYTNSSYRPVKKIAESAQAGAGTTVITGLGVGLEAVWISGISIVGAILIAYTAVGWQGWTTAPTPELGLYGIGLAAASMLAVTGMIISIDAFGPITDNAGGIAEMAGLPAEARAITDPLDAVGNTTKAITKGYAIGSAVLASLALFAAYTFATAQAWCGSGSSVTISCWTSFTSMLTIDQPLIV